MDDERAVTEYYRAIDAGEYDSLAAVLAPEFVHRRPDRTIEGRSAFVRFMREERPRTDTTHEIDARFVANTSAEREHDGSDDEATRDVAVAGRLRAADGDTLFGFVDRHELAAGTIVAITTYTR